MSGEYRVMMSAVFTGQHEGFRASDGAIVAEFCGPDAESNARDFAAMKNGEVPEKYARLVEALHRSFKTDPMMDGSTRLRGGVDPVLFENLVLPALAAVEGKR